MYTQYPDEMPELLRSFCYTADRFYVEHREANNHLTYFRLYAQSCFSKEVSNPYQQLLKAAAGQDIDAMLERSTQLNVAQFPSLVVAIRSLLHEPTLNVTRDNLLWDLYRAPHLIQTKQIDPNLIYSLIYTYPSHAENLLLDAIVYNTPLDWVEVSKSTQYGGLACMGSQPAIDCYHAHKTFYNLISVALGAPDTFEAIIASHPNIDERFKSLAILGDAPLFSKIAHQLFLVESTDIHDAMKLMFNEQISTRQPLLDKGNSTWFSYDPEHTKQLCNDMPAKRPQALFQPLISHSIGKAVPYLKIVEAIYAHS